MISYAPRRQPMSRRSSEGSISPNCAARSRARSFRPMRVTGKKLHGGGLMIGIASAFADPFVEKLLSAQTLTDLLKNGWPRDMLAERPEGFEGLDLNTLGNALQLYLAADYGIGEFRVPVPINLPLPRQFRIHLTLSDWTWKLSGLDLPTALQDRLARELIKQGQNKPAR